MKKIKILLAAVCLLSSLSVRANTDKIEYRLSWVGDGINVRVEMTTTANSVQFNYGNEGAGGLKEQIHWLKDISAEDGNLEIDSTHHAFLVMTRRGKASFSYTVRHKVIDKTGGHGCIYDMFSPDIDSAMLYTATYNLFVKPQTLEDIPATVSWDKTPQFPVFCLYNPGHGTEAYTGTVAEITSSVIVGDPLLTVDTVVVDGHLNYLVTAIRKHREQNRQELITFMKRLYSNATHFWGDSMQAPYSLVIYPFRTNTFSVSGNGYDNGFLSRYDATCDTILTLDRRDVYTHEIGHKWIGSGPFWFGEGFNEMQTAYQLVASHLDQPEYFLTYLNVALKGLYHNPHRNEPDSVAETHFWDDGQYIWLLYWRGFSYAFYLAGEIEHHTGSKNAYRAMMMALKPDINEMTQEKFLKDMERVLDRKILAKSFQQYILEGKDIDYRKAHLPSGCAVYYLPTGEPQMKVTDPAKFAQHFIE